MFEDWAGVPVLAYTIVVLVEDWDPYSQILMLGTYHSLIIILKIIGFKTIQQASCMLLTKMINTLHFYDFHTLQPITQSTDSAFSERKDTAYLKTGNASSKSFSQKVNPKLNVPIMNHSLDPPLPMMYAIVDFESVHLVLVAILYCTCGILFVPRMC